MSIDHYIVPIPAKAFICPDWKSLCEETGTKWCHYCLDKKYGGFVVEDKGAIVLICTDNLCAIIEEKNRQAQAITFHDPTSSTVSLVDYTIDIPPSARICANWPSLIGAIRECPGSTVVRNYGGFVVEEDGVVIFVCDKEMCHAIIRPRRFNELLDEIAEQVPSKSQDK